MLRIVHERGGHEEVGSEQQVGLDELCRLAAQEMLALALEAERQGYLERHALRSTRRVSTQAQSEVNRSQLYCRSISACSTSCRCRCSTADASSSS